MYTGYCLFSGPSNNSTQAIATNDEGKLFKVSISNNTANISDILDAENNIDVLINEKEKKEDDYNQEKTSRSMSIMGLIMSAAVAGFAWFIIAFIASMLPISIVATIVTPIITFLGFSALTINFFGFPWNRRKEMKKIRQEIKNLEIAIQVKEKEHSVLKQNANYKAAEITDKEVILPYEFTGEPCNVQTKCTCKAYVKKMSPKS